MVKSKSTQNASSTQEDDESEYVYDIYYTNNRDFNFRALESALTVEALSSDPMYSGRFDNESDEDEQVYEDEDDSNDEENWRNDYPDEDPRFFENAEGTYNYNEGKGLFSSFRLFN